jgi:hypothetical protein
MVRKPFSLTVLQVSSASLCTFNNTVPEAICIHSCYPFSMSPVCAFVIPCTCFFFKSKSTLRISIKFRIGTCLRVRASQIQGARSPLAPSICESTVWNSFHVTFLRGRSLLVMLWNTWDPVYSLPISFQIHFDRIPLLSLSPPPSVEPG